MSSKNLRVTIFANGAADGGKLLEISSGITLADLLTQASAKLSEGGAAVTYTRVFLSKGGELSDTSAIRDDDLLYFSAGEPFVAPASAANDAVKYHFLSSIALNAVAQAASLYERSSSAVKSHAPTVVANSLERVEGVASDLAQRYDLTNRVAGIGSPLLQWADGHVDAAYESLLKRRQSFTVFLHSPLAQRVNETLVIPMRVKLLNGYSTLTDDFRVKSEEAFSRIHASVQAGKEKASDLRTHAEAFVADVKARLGPVWNERFAGPSMEFFNTVTTEYATLLKKADNQKIELKNLFASVRTQLGRKWEESVAAAYDKYDAAYRSAFDVYTSRVKEPAAAFYLKGFEAYQALQATSAQGKVTLQEFLGALRVKMGSQLWSDALLEPAKALFESFSNPSSEKAEAKDGKAEAAKSS